MKPSVRPILFRLLAHVYVPTILVITSTSLMARPHAAIAADWSDWKAVPDQIQAGVDVRLQAESSRKLGPQIHVQFRNRYGQKVTVAYVLQGEDVDHVTRQIEGVAELNTGDQRLNKEQERAQTVPFSTLTGVAFSRITFSGATPKPTAVGSRCDSAETRRLEHDLEGAQADAITAESAKFDAEDFLARVRRSQERGTPLVLGEGRAVNSVMGSDDIAKAEMRARDAKTTHENALKVVDVLRQRLDESRKSDADAVTARQTLASRLAPTKQWADAGEWPKVEAAFRAALADRTLTLADSDRALLQLNLGLAQSHQNRNADALVAFTEACRLAPTNAACHSELAGALIADNHLDEAATSLTEAIRLSPNEARYHYNLGYVREKQNRLKDAEAAYREALRLDSGNAGYQERLKAVTEGPVATTKL